MRTQAASLSGAEAVTSVDVSRLRSPGARATAGWDWLIEMHLASAEDAAGIAREQPCRDLLADLRLLGMNPSLVLVDGTLPLEG
jgi:hypothetical protein